MDRKKTFTIDKLEERIAPTVVGLYVPGADNANGHASPGANGQGCENANENGLSGGSKGNGAFCGGSECPT